MERLSKALDLINKQMKEEYGQDFKLEEGGEIACVLNDAVVILGIENKEVQCKVLLGAPLKVDYSIDSEE